MELEILAQPHSAAVGDRLIAELRSGNWDCFRCVVAFAKISGARYLDGPLREFVELGGRATVTLGVDHGGTSFEAASQLAGAVHAGGQLILAKNIDPRHVTFHPKIYAFIAGPQAARALIIVGSSNITEGGLFSNHELSTAVALDSSIQTDAEVISAALSTLDRWQDTSSGLAIVGNKRGLLQFRKSGLLPSEKQIAAKSRRDGSPVPSAGDTPRGLSQQAPRRVPAHPQSMGPSLVQLPTGDDSERSSAKSRGEPSAVPRGVVGGIHNALLIDISTGTDKTEIYLSKTALGEDPGFFGHPFTGLTTPKQANSEPQPQLDPRPTVDVRLLDEDGGVAVEYTNHALKVWEYVNGPNANHDVRITIPAPLLHALPHGCILEMRRRPIRPGIDYRLDFLTPGSAEWALARSLATRPLPGGKRMIGWG